MNDVVTEIRQCLSSLSPTILIVEDDSDQHRGHAGAKHGGGHYRIRIVSEKFRGLSRLEVHRLIYTSLGTLMQQKIHALQLDAQAP